MDIIINVIADVSSLINIRRYSEHNRPALARIAGERYLQYLKRRFIANSSGTGEWPPLEDSTIRKKESRGVDNPDAILRETDTLLESLGMKVIGNTTYVGIVDDGPIPRPTKRVSGLVDLTVVHQYGEGNNPVREVIDSPPDHVRKRIVEDIRDKYNDVIRKMRRRRG